MSNEVTFKVKGGYFCWDALSQQKYKRTMYVHIFSLGRPGCKSLIPIFSAWMACPGRNMVGTVRPG